ncbi:MAG: radical SAM protein, partial [Deltaproteobacteria bacterium]
MVGGKLKGGRPHEGNLSYYYDPLPTNCVADFVCPASRGCGYPDYSVSRGPEHGYKNLAVFYQACSFNCLYCQNYPFREWTRVPGATSADELARA